MDSKSTIKGRARKSKKSFSCSVIPFRTFSNKTLKCGGDFPSVVVPGVKTVSVVQSNFGALQSNKECPVFRTTCLGSICTKYELVKEFSYYDLHEHQWKGQGLVMEMELPVSQKRVQRHVVVIHNCKYQELELYKMDHKDFQLPSQFDF